jgi:hypothetical protein
VCGDDIIYSSNWRIFDILETFKIERNVGLVNVITHGFHFHHMLFFSMPTPNLPFSRCYWLFDLTNQRNTGLLVRIVQWEVDVFV